MTAFLSWTKESICANIEDAVVYEDRQRLAGTSTVFCKYCRYIVQKTY